MLAAAELEAAADEEEAGAEEAGAEEAGAEEDSGGGFLQRASEAGRTFSVKSC